MKKKGIALLAAFVLLVVGIGAGTLAWLTDKTKTITNTFTTSDIDIALSETTGTEYQMIPGYTLAKDPTVTVTKGSEDCYLFVKLEKSSNFGTYMTYEIADGWTQLTEDKDKNPITDLIYYRTVNKNTLDQTFAVLKNNQVTVEESVTKELMNALSESNYPTLSITAYASQLHKNADTTFTAAEAWANVNPDSNN